MKKLLLWVSAVAIAGLTAACDAQSSSSFNPTAPSASGLNGGRSAPLATGAQVGSQSPADPCTPPPGADTHFRPGPGAPVPGAEPSCQTGNEPDPGLDYGGTPPETPGTPDTDFRPAPAR
jgi:hypothetical protein